MATQSPLWHSDLMSNASSKQHARSRVLGSRAFAAISAVEGLKLSRDSKARLDTLRSGTLGGEERRSAVRDAYRSLRTSK
jgi:hypothetical protein